MIDVLKAKARAGVDVRVMGWISFSGMADYGVATSSVRNKIGIADINLSTMASIRELRNEPALADRACLNIIAHSAGASHTKLVLVGNGTTATGYTGGLDLVNDRHGAPPHPAGQWHDVQAKVQGPAVLAMYEFYRNIWNELRAREVRSFRDGNVKVASHTPGTPYLPTRNLPTTPVGKHHVQSLRTVPRFNYKSTNLLPENQKISFAPDGLFEVRSAWFNAVLTAERYVYIEDQGFWSVDVMAWLNRVLKIRDDLKVVLIKGINDPNDPPIPAYANVALWNGLLHDLNPQQRGRVRAFLRDVFVHTKSTIVDDHWALIGSANAYQRSLYSDLEHAVGLLDEEDALVRQYRTQLWGDTFGLIGPAEQSRIADLDQALHVWEPEWGTAGSGVTLPSNVVPLTLPTAETRLTDSEQDQHDRYYDVDSRFPWGLPAMSSSMFVTVNEFMREKWPSFLPRPSDPAVLDHVWIEPPHTTADVDHGRLATRLLFERELVLGLPGFDAVSVVLAPDSSPSAPAQLGFAIDVLPKTALRLTDAPVALRFGPELLRPMRKVTSGGDARYEPDPGRPFVQFTVPKLSGSAGSDGFSADAPFTAPLPYPVQIGDTGVVIDSATVGFHQAGGKACLVLQWKEGALNRLLGRFVPNLGDRSPAGEQQVTLRLIIGDGLEEVRLDWQAASGAAFALPGLSVGVPASSRFSLLLMRQGAGLGRAAFVVTLAGDGPVTAGSTFAWGRDGDRELHNDEPPQPPGKPLFSVTLEPADGPRSLVLLDVALGAPKLPGFFRELTAPIAPLDLNDPASLCKPVAFDPVDLQDGWTAKLSVNIDAGGGAFTLPFLKQGQGDDAQFLQLYTPTPLEGLPITLPQGRSASTSGCGCAY
ncbi:phospholipase D family protein [Actinomadura yumaensis]|uniref:phospholipase D family protein n=1 Tax=Actinomadura yumaensis TaxID=111807 RepID=UPI003607DC2A